MSELKTKSMDFLNEGVQLLTEYEEIIEAKGCTPIKEELKPYAAYLLNNLFEDLNEANTTADMKPFEDMLPALLRKGFANISLLGYVGIQPVNNKQSAFYVERTYFAGPKSREINGQLKSLSRSGDAEFASFVILVSVSNAQYASITEGTSVIKVAGGTGNDLADIVYKEQGAKNTAKLLIKLKVNSNLTGGYESLPAVGNIYLTGVNANVAMTHVWTNQVGRHVVLSMYGGQKTTYEGEILNDFNRMKISIESVPVTVESNKLGFEISMEVMTDMLKQHGEDAKKRIVNAVQWQLASQINMKLFNLMTSSAEIVKDWVYADADGRNEYEKFQTLFRKVALERNRIGSKNTVSRANFAIVSQGTASIIERSPGFVRALEDESGAGFVKIGSLDNIEYLLDTWSTHEYMLLGYKSKTDNSQAGVFWCPYVPISMDTAPDPDLPSRKIVLFTERSAYVKNPFGSSEYLSYWDIDLTGSTIG